MKKTLMMAAVLVLVGCGEKKADAGRRYRRDGSCRCRHRHGWHVARQHAMSSDSTMARDTTKK